MILRPRVLFSLLFSASVLGLACPGCSDESASTSNRFTERPSPEESFAGIVRFVQDQVETGAGGMPSGFVAESGGRRSHFTLRNEVTSEFHPPAQPDGIYRGSITVSSRSSYSLRVDEQEDTGDDAQDDAAQNSFDGDTLADSGVEVLDNSLVLSPSPEGDAPPVGPRGVKVSRKDDEDVSTFEFVYENDRWVLKTEPDPETERALKRAFERALELQ